jgi:hypothetical protein
MFVFLAALVLDTAALLRLFWACLAGYLGAVPRVIAFATLVVVASPALRAAYRYLTAPEPAAAGEARCRTATVRARKPERQRRIAEDAPAAGARRTRAVVKTE